MSTEVPANQSMMSSPQWDLTFTLHCPDPLYMKLVRYTGVELPNQEFYDDLGINPDSSEPKFTLFPSDSPRVMALQDIIHHLKEYQETRMKYSIRVYNPTEKFAAMAKVVRDDKKQVNNARLEDVTPQIGDSAEICNTLRGRASFPLETINTQVSRSTSPARRRQIEASAACGKGKGKEQHEELSKTETPPTPPKDIKALAKLSIITDAPSTTTVLQMKGRQALGAISPTTAKAESASSAKPTINDRWAYSDEDEDSTSEDWDWSSRPSSDIGLKRNPADPTAMVAPHPPAKVSPPLPPKESAHKPLLDPNQIKDVERIVAEAVKSTPAGIEGDQIHQALLSMLENMRTGTAAPQLDDRICAKPPQSSQPEVSTKIAQTIKRPRCVPTSAPIELVVPTPPLPKPTPAAGLTLTRPSEKLKNDLVSSRVAGYDSACDQRSILAEITKSNNPSLCRDNNATILAPLSLISFTKPSQSLITITKPLEEFSSDLMFRLDEINEADIRARIWDVWGPEWSDPSMADLMAYVRHNGACMCDENVPFAEWVMENSLSGDVHLRIAQKAGNSQNSSAPQETSLPPPSKVAETTPVVPQISTQLSTSRYGLKPEDILTSANPSPLILSPTTELNAPFVNVAHSDSGSDFTDQAILSPNSQNTLKMRYLADLSACTLNTPASTRVLDILHDENVRLDSSLGLKLLDLAKSLRTDGDLAKSKEDEITKDEEKADRREIMLKKVLEKLNDHSEMLNAIAEASGVNLLDEDGNEAAGHHTQIKSANAEKPLPFPLIAKEATTTVQPDIAAAVSTSVTDAMNILSEVTASLALHTPALTPQPLAADNNTVDSTSSAPSALRDLAETINRSPLFAPTSPTELADQEARPLPSVEDHQQSESETSDTQSDTGTIHNPRPTSPSPCRNPFADPPRFGRSYTPTHPINRGTPSNPTREQVHSTSEAFARYAANQQAFPSGPAFQRNHWVPGPRGLEAARADHARFWGDIDAYANGPAPHSHNQHPFHPHMYRPGPAESGSYPGPHPGFGFGHPAARNQSNENDPPFGFRRFAQGNHNPYLPSSWGMSTANQSERPANPFGAFGSRANDHGERSAAYRGFRDF